MAGGENRRPRRGRGGHGRSLARAMLWLLPVACLGTAAVWGWLGLNELRERRAGDDYYANLAAAVVAVAGEADSAAGGERASGGGAAAGEASTGGAGIPGGSTGLDMAAFGGAGATSGGTAEGEAATGGTMAAGGGAAAGEASTGGTGISGGSAGLDVAAFGGSGVKLSGGARPSAVDFDALRRRCPDAVCWISIEGTRVNYPVVQGGDNLYYLKHLPDGTANSAGSILMDAACDPLFGNDVTILHGHHMRSGAMFGSLDAYREAAYAGAHPVIRLYTPDGDWDVDVFAACTVDGATFGYPTMFAGEQAFDRFVAQLKAASAFDSGVALAYGDRLLLLSTCAYSFADARFVVAGRIRQP